MIFPLRFALGNLLFGATGGVGALYRLETVSPLASEEQLGGWWQALSRLPYELRGDLSVYRVNRAYPAARYAAETTGMVDARHADPADWNRYLEGQQRHMGGLRSTVPEVYVLTRLEGAKRGLIARVTRPRRKRSAPVGATELERLNGLERQANATVLARLRGRRATTLELQWLLRRAAFRGLVEPELDEWWQPAALEVVTPDGRVAYEPLGTDIVSLANPPIDPHPRHVEVESEAGRSFQAFLTRGALPAARYLHDGADLLSRPLEQLEDAVDAVEHLRYVSNDDAIARVRRQVQRADVAASEAHSGSESGESLSLTQEQARDLSRGLLAYLESDEHPPLLLSTSHLAVGAKDAEQLEAAVQRVRGAYGSVRLNRLVGRQEALFFDCLLRVDGGRVEDGRDVLTVEQFGALMPIAASHVGSRRGPYVGYTTAGRRPVKLNLRDAPQQSRPPAVLLAGTLGSGKTLALELLLYQSVLSGSRVIDIDPKPDHKLEDLPELDGRARVIEIGADDSCRGLLDPLVIVPGRAGEDLATNYLLQLLPEHRPEWATEVRRHVRATILEHPHSTMVEVLRRLLNSGDRDAAAAGKSIEVWSESPLGQLGFADAHPNGSRPVATAQLTTIKAHALELPEAGVGRELYDDTERISVATLKLLVAFGMSLARADRSMHKVLSCDEAWFLLASTDGRRLLSRLIHMGRALNATLLLAVQLLRGLEGVEELVGTRLFFGQKSSAEARLALERLDLDPGDKTLVDWLRQARKGLCLFGDTEDRVAKVQFDLVYRHLLDALDTAPRGAGAVA